MEIPVGVWVHYGYVSSPYSTSALRIVDADETLLVGREVELETVLRDLISGGQLVALEGDYGVGKSSLAAVAASTASHWREHRKSSPLILPAASPLELEANDTVAAFEQRAYYQVAGAILARADALVHDGFNLGQLRDFRSWLQSPAGGGWTAGIGASFPQSLDFNVSVGRNREPNTGVGFSDAGVITLIDSWLNELFPTPLDGGVVLLLDNLEVLRKHPDRVDLFEALRDRLFKRNGLRWIISGAEGTVRVALNTPKMTGVFPEPIDLLPLPHDKIQEVIVRREAALRSRADAKLPVSPAAFEQAYVQTGRNLRVTLGLAERFALRTQPSEMAWMSQEQRDQAFHSWRAAEGRRVVDQTAGQLSAASWRVLSTLVNDRDGIATPGDYKAFGYSSMSSLTPQIKKLARLGLLTYAVDEDDGRRRLITASERGRLAVAARLTPETPV